MVAGVAYLGFRVAFTMSPTAYAWLFLLAEVQLFATSAVFFRLLSLQRDAPALPAEGLVPDPTVDVFVCAYRESAGLVRSTLTAARDMQGRHRTWLADDGDREELRALAAELDVGYLARGVNTDFKAGNLNHALGHSDGEFVVVLDADHVVRSSFLSRLLPHLVDPTVAFVQVPQVTYNSGSFQHIGDWHESGVFHHVQQRGAHWANGPVFVGTGAVLRRSALDQIGGFATASVTEDVNTSLRLHAAGFRSVYVDEALAFLLAPATPHAYATQRSRWAEGAMQLLRLENPLVVPGLSWRQRVHYLANWLGFAGAIPHLILVVAPALFVLAGVAPVAVEPAIGVPVLVGHVGIDMSVYLLLAGRWGSPVRGESYRMVNLGIQLRALWRLVVPAGAVFQLTPKGAHRGMPVGVWLPAAAVFLLNGTAVAVGTSSLLEGQVEPLSTGVAVALGAFFAWSALVALGKMGWHRVAAPHTVPVHLWAHAVIEGKRHTVQISHLGLDVAWVSAEYVGLSGPFLLDLAPIGLAEAVRAIPKVESGGSVQCQLELGPSAGDAVRRYLFESVLPGRQAAMAIGGPPPHPVHQIETAAQRNQAEIAQNVESPTSTR